jgi:hypothetical protein
MDRALREFRIRGVATNLTFLEAIIGHPKFRNNTYTTRFIDTTPELFEQVKRQDRATKLLTYLGRCDRQRPSGDQGPAIAAGRCRRRRSAVPGMSMPEGRNQAASSTNSARRGSPTGCAGRSASDDRHDHARRPPVAAGDAHAHHDIVKPSPVPMRGRCRNFCRWNAGAARPSTSSMRFPHRGSVGAARKSASRCPNLLCRCCCAAPTASATPIIPTMWSSISCGRQRRAGSICSACSTASTGSRTCASRWTPCARRTSCAKQRSATPATFSIRRGRNTT